MGRNFIYLFFVFFGGGGGGVGGVSHMRNTLPFCPFILHFAGYLWIVDTTYTEQPLPEWGSKIVGALNTWATKGEHDSLNFPQQCYKYPKQPTSNVFHYYTSIQSRCRATKFAAMIYFCHITRFPSNAIGSELVRHSREQWKKNGDMYTTTPRLLEG